MSNSLKKQLINNTLWVYGGKIIAQVIGLVATILVIRNLPVETYGTYTFLFGLFFVYQLFITSPIKNVILRYIPEFVSSGNHSVVRKLIFYSHIFAICFIAVFSYALNIFQDDFSEFFNFPDFGIHLKAFVVFAFCYALKVMSETLIASFLKHPLSTKANIIVVILRSSLYFVFLSKISVDILLYIEAFVSIVYFLFVSRGIFTEMMQKNKGIANLTPSDTLIRSRIFRFYSLSFFSELGYGIIGKTSDQYIIAAISSPFYVGLYGFALKIYEMFYKVLPFREFESVLKPVFFKRFANTKNEQEISDFYIFTVKVLLPLFMFPVLYFFVFGKVIIVQVFDEKYLPAYWVTCVSLVGLVFQGLFYPLNLVIQLKERVEINLYSRIIVVFSIAAGVYAMKHWGIVGVAAATVVGELLKNLLMFFLIKRCVKVNYELGIFIKYGLIGFIIIVAFVPFISVVQNVVGLLLGSTGFVCVYLFLLVNFHALYNSELFRLKKVICSNKRLGKLLIYIEPVINKLNLNR